MENLIMIATLAGIAYLLGSIPSAVWIGKKFYGTDVREHGSHNAGATNTLRVLGKRAALPVFGMDLAKGFLAVTFAKWSMAWDLLPYFKGSDRYYEVLILVIIGVVAGHIFPLFAQFKGGKGVATLAGAMLALLPGAVGLCLLTFIAVLAVSHYVSLSSMTAGIMLPIYVMFVFGERSVLLILFCCLISVLLLVTHRKNIKRLLARTESKIYLFNKPK